MVPCHKVGPKLKHFKLLNSPRRALGMAMYSNILVPELVVLHAWHAMSSGSG